MPFPRSAEHLHIAMISVHTDPYGEAGTGDVGGMNIVIRETAAQLVAAGHSVDVFIRRSRPDAEGTRRLGERLRVVALNAGPAHPLSKGEHEAVVPAFARALGAYGGYDVVHAHHWYSGLAAERWAQDARAAFVQSFHSIAAPAASPLDAGERPEVPARLDAERHLARSADAVITVSLAERDTVVERLGAAPEHVAVVHPGVDAVRFHPRDATAADARRDLVAAARIEPLKGIDLAIEALALVPEPERADLVVAGGESSQADGELERLQTLAARLGIAGRVHFVGALGRAELAARMRDALAVIVPSHSETFGLCALEASASGVPVIAAAAGGLGEAVLDGRTGLLLPTRRAADWASAITRLIEHPDEAARLGRAGRAHAETQTWQRSAASLAHAYRTVIARTIES